MIAAQTLDGESLFLMLDLLVVPYFLWIAAPIIFPTQGALRALWIVLAGLGAYLGLTALAESLQLDWAIVPSYISDPAVGIHADRARGPYVESVANGMMLTICGGGAAAFAMGSPVGPKKVVGFAIVSLCSLGVVLTLTRAVWIGAVVAVAVVIAYQPRARRNLIRVGPVVVAAIVGVVAVVPGLSTAISERSDSADPVYDRLNTNAAAIRMIDTHPLFGVGWNHAADVMAGYLRLGADYPLTNASAHIRPHNVYLGRFAELGLIGGSAWLAVLVIAVVVPTFFVTRGRSAEVKTVMLIVTVTYLVASLFGPVPYSQPNYFVMLLAGCAALDITEGRWRKVEN